MEPHNSHKEWAQKRRQKKYSKARDCRKASSQGQTLRRSSTGRLAGDSCADQRYMNQNTALHYPNPIERHLGKHNPTASDIQSNLADIIENTDPIEVIHCPVGKSNRVQKNVSWDVRRRCPENSYFDRGKDETYLVYKYSSTEREDADIWKIRKTAQLKKMGEEIPQSIEIVDRSALARKKARHRNTYKPPIVNEKSLRHRYRCQLNENSKPLYPLYDYFIYDLGKNKWMSAFGSTHHWGWFYLHGKKQYLKLLSGIDRYTVYVAVDEIEKERNFDKFHSKKSKKSKSVDEAPKKKSMPVRNKSKRDGYSNNGRRQCKSSQTGDDDDTRHWECLGNYCGNLNGYYVNLNEELKVDKLFRLGGNPSNPSYKASQIGRLIRWIKVVPCNIRQHPSFQIYGCDVDLLSKPIIPNPHQSLQPSNHDTIQSVATEEKKCDYDWDNSPLRISSGSRTLNANRDDGTEENEIVVIGVSGARPHLHWSNHTEWPESSWGWNPGYDGRMLKRKEFERYYKHVKKANYDEPPIVI